MITAKVYASLKGLCKLRSHFYQEVLVMLKLFLSCDHSLVDHVLNSYGVLGIEDITDPLLVQVIPVLLIGEVFQ
jgi:hypothetical protein